MSRTPAVAERATAPARAADFLSMLDRSRDEIAKLLPEHVAIDRVMRVARNAYQMNPAIQQCEPKSILAAVMKACELGLEPGGARKHAWLIPYKGKCEFQVGYLGVLELARRTREFRVIEAVVVRQKDAFRVVRSPAPEVRHEPYLGDQDSGPMTHVYAYAMLRSGDLVFESMDRQTVDAIRRSSKCPDSPAWKTWPDQMACRSVLNRLLKRQPQSVELAEALEACAAEFTQEAIGRISTEGHRSHSAALASHLRGRSLPAPEPEFTASEGVSRPVYSEDDAAAIASAEAMDEADAREPGAD